MLFLTKNTVSELNFTPPSKPSIIWTFIHLSKSDRINAKRISNRIFSKEELIIVAPNPNSGCFTMRSYLENIPLNIQVFDIAGNLILTKETITNKPFCLNKDLSSNIYIIKYSNERYNIHGVKKLYIINE